MQGYPLRIIIPGYIGEQPFCLLRYHGCALYVQDSYTFTAH